MSVRDLVGVFSRSFLVGYFTPAIIAWTTLILLTRGGHPSRFSDLTLVGQVVVVVTLAAVTAAPLSALRYEIRGAFTTGSFLPRTLRTAFARTERARFERLARDRTNGTKLTELDRRFPDTPERIRPTRFGNVVGAYQAYPASRFGLDYVVVWKRIDVLLTPRETELHAVARADVDAFLNLSVLSAIAAVGVFVERLYHPSPVAASAIGIWLLGYLSYRLAVDAEQRLGNAQRAAFDLHRLELYERFGLRWPPAPLQEKLMAQGLSGRMLWPTIELAPGWWRTGMVWAMTIRGEEDSPADIRTPFPPPSPPKPSIS
jgi:hypothetical protein